MNTSKLESTWSQELAEYMYVRYGIDINEVICEAILEVEDAENSSNNETQIAQKILKHKIENIPEKN